MKASSVTDVVDALEQELAEAESSGAVKEYSENEKKLHRELLLHVADYRAAVAMRMAQEGGKDGA